LMIANMFVDELGGVIDVSSEKGMGTVFRVRLPDKKPSA